jgi:hypothetical protein
MPHQLPLIGALALLTQCALSASCKASTLKKALPSLPGVEIKNVEAKEVLQWAEYATSAPTVPFLPVQPGLPIDFCDVTVTYGHTGEF